MCVDGFRRMAVCVDVCTLRKTCSQWNHHKAMASLSSSSASTSTNVCIASVPLPFKTTKTKHGPTLKTSHQQLSSHLALSSHMLNEFILPVLPVVENSDVNSYAMGLVATQRPKTKCFHLERFCEWLCLLLLVGDQRPPFVEQHCSVRRELYFDPIHTVKNVFCFIWDQRDLIATSFALSLVLPVSWVDQSLRCSVLKLNVLSYKDVLCKRNRTFSMNWLCSFFS